MRKKRTTFDLVVTTAPKTVEERMNALLEEFPEINRVHVIYKGQRIGGGCERVASVDIYSREDED